MFLCECKVVKKQNKDLNEKIEKKVWEKNEIMVGMKKEEKDFQ